MIYADQADDAHLAVDQPRHLFASYSNPDITEHCTYLDSRSRFNPANCAHDSAYGSCAARGHALMVISWS